MLRLTHLLAAAVGLVKLQQPLGQSDASQQVLDETLDPDFAAFLLSRRHFQELLDGDDLPAQKGHAASPDLLSFLSADSSGTSLAAPAGSRRR